MYRDIKDLRLNELDSNLLALDHIFVPFSFETVIWSSPENGDDFAGDTTTTGVLAVDGAAVSGNIETQGDDDWFAVTVAAGDLVQFNMDRITLSDPVMHLYDSVGTQLARNDNFNGLNSQFIYDFNTAGTYYISARELGDNSTGNYIVSATAITDDYAGDTTTTGMISLGGSTSGNFDFGRDADWFAFTLTGDQIVDFSLDITPPNIDIFDASGNRIIRDFFDDNLIFQGSAGDYFVGVQGGSNQTGPYTLTATEIFDDYTADTTTSGTIAINGLTSGNFDFEEDEDWFAFTLTGDQIVDFSLDITPRNIDIFDASGNRITGETFDDNLIFQGSAGDYFVGVQSGSNQTGPYTLTATEIFDDYTADTTTTGMIALGGATNGIFDFEFDADWFAFTLTGSQTVDFSVDITPRNIDIFDASGNRITGDFFDDNLIFQGSAGDYFVGVQSGSNQTGPYTLTATEIFDDYTADTTTSGTIAINGLTSGNFDFEEDEDWFAFTLTGDQIIDFSLSAQVRQITIYDSSGNFITGDFSEENSTFTGTAGDYFIGVRGEFSQRGPYTLTATEIFDDYAGDTTTTGMIALGGSTSGLFDFKRDADWFAFTLTGSQTVDFSLDITPRNIEIFDSLGNRIASEFFQDNIVFQGVAGNYFVGVQSDFDQTGPYVLTATEIVDDYTADTTTTGMIALGGTVNGSFDFEEDEDWFAFTLTGDQFVGFSLSMQVRQITIYDSSGNFITSDSFENDLVFDGSAGDYFIGVQGNSNQTGAYTLTATEIIDDYAGDTTTTGLISLNGSTSGNFDFELDADWFAFTLTGDQTVEFTIDSSIRRLDIFDASGNRIATEFSDDNLLFQGAAGNYFIGVESNFNQTGNYTLTTTEIFDDYAADTTTTGMITVGGSTIGSFDFDDDTDWFAFTFTGDQIVDFSLSTDVRRIDIYDSSGNFLVGTSLNDHYTFVGTTGDYFVSIRGDSDQRGSYTLTATEIFDDYAGDITTTGMIALGGTETGNFDYDRDADWFAFTLTVNQVVDFSLDVRARNFNIYDAFGNRITGETFDDSLIFQGSAGNYFVSVASDTDQAGPYRLSATEIFDDYAANNSTTGVIALEGSTNGNFEFGDDEDWFAFTLTGDQMVEFSLSTGVRIITIYDSAGNDIARDSFEDKYLFDGTAGDYFIGIRSNSNQTDAYTLMATEIFDEHAANRTTTGLITLGGSTSGSFDFEEDEDWFAFTLTEDQSVAFSLSTQARQITIYNAVGNFLASDSFDDNLVFDGTAGNYFIGIRGNSDQSGPYTLTSTPLLPDVPGDISSTIAISPGQTIDGFIETRDDQDWFAITVNAGDALSIYHDRDLLDDPFLRLLDSAGNEIASNDNRNGMSSQIDFLFNTSGTYYISAQARNFGDTGSYSLSVSPFGNNGGFGNDSLMGTADRDIIFGREGNDIINGLADNDVLDGGLGIDTLFGGTGDDVLYGRDGNDTLTGGDGADELQGGAGDDVLYGSAGSDIISGGDGQDILDGGAGIDFLSFVSSLTGRIFFMKDFNLNNGTFEGDQFTNFEGLGGTQGDDIFNGTTGNDFMLGLAGNDTIRSGAGDDTADGGDGADTILGNSGDDVLFGGADDDLIIGGGGNDTVNGDAGNDSLSGQGSDDILNGGLGDDFILGGSGADTISGGDGADDINAGGGNDTVSGDAGNDVINAGGGADVVMGGDGDDALFGNNQNDTIFGELGIDTISGGSGNDMLDGGEGNDIISGDGSKDTLFGDDGDDMLFGGSGGDTLDGGSGADTLEGGGGNDILTGGIGADVFVQASGFRADRITDFEDGIDLIDFSGNTTVNDFAKVMNSAFQQGTTVRIELNPNNILVLENFDLTDLDASDFIF